MVRLLVAVLAVAALAPCAALAQTPSRGSVVSSDAAAQNVPYETVVARLRLVEKDRAMRAAFGETPAGAALARVATLGFWGVRQDHPAEARHAALALAVLRRAPADALTILRAGLAKLPNRYGAERQLLIQLGAQLPAPRAAVVAMLQAEISRPVASEPDAEPFSAAVATDLLLAVVPDAAGRDAALAAALRGQPDAGVRRLVLARYEAADAARATALARQFDLRPR